MNLARRGIHATLPPSIRLQFLGEWYVQAQVPGLLTPSRCGRQVFGRYDDGSVSVHNSGTVDIGTGLVVELCGVAKGRSPVVPGELITRLVFLLFLQFATSKN